MRSIALTGLACLTVTLTAGPAASRDLEPEVGIPGAVLFAALGTMNTGFQLAKPHSKGWRITSYIVSGMGTVIGIAMTAIGGGQSRMGVLGSGLACLATNGAALGLAIYGSVRPDPAPRVQLVPLLGVGRNGALLAGAGLRLHVF